MILLTRKTGINLTTAVFHISRGSGRNNPSKMPFLFGDFPITKLGINVRDKVS